VNAAVTIPLRNQLAEIARISRLVEEFAAAHAISPDVVLCVNLALDEVITNVISYAYGDAREHEIVTRLMLEGDDVIVEVEDDGRAYNPLDAPAVDLDTPAVDRPIGGLGIHIVRTVMDSLDYRRVDDRNVFVMRKAARRGAS